MVKTALYTVTYSGQFYKGRHLSLEEIFPRAADMGFDAIEIGAKRPVASPLDIDASRRRALREASVRSGLEIGCIASYTNLASPVLEQREAHLLMLRETIRLAHDLESPVVRAFAAWPGVTLRDGQSYYEIAKSYAWHDVTGLEQWHWARECLEEAGRWGEEYGVVIALQNHRPVTETYRDTLDMVREVDSRWVQACIDAPHLGDQTDDGVRQAILETGAHQVWSHFGGFQETADRRVLEETGEGTVAVNYPAFFRALLEIGYSGGIAYEGCGPALVDHDYRGIEEVDRRVRLALAYMQREIEAATRDAGTPTAAPGAEQR